MDSKTLLRQDSLQIHTQENRQESINRMPTMNLPPAQQQEEKKRPGVLTAKQARKLAEEGMPSVYLLGQSIMDSRVNAEGEGNLPDSKEMLDVKNKIEMLQSFLSNSMPPFAKTAEEENTYRQEIDGTNLAINMMYNKLIASMDAWLENKDSLADATEERIRMLTQLREQVLQEESLFAQSVRAYRDSKIGSELAQKGEAHTWAEMLRYQRSDKIDIDADPECMEMTGAGTSNVMKISRNGKTYYFKEEENTLKGDLYEIADQVAVGRKELLPETIKDFKEALEQEELRDDVIMRKNIRTVFTHMTKEQDPYEKIKGVRGPLSNFIAVLSEDQKKAFKDYYISFYRAQLSQDISEGSARIEQGRNLSRRNVATTRLANLMGIGDMFAESRTALVKYNGKTIVGNLMEDAGGLSSTEVRKRQMDGYSKTAEEQIIMLQVFDLLCGQVDRHFGNMMFHVEDDQIVGIKCIDNDMSFGNIEYWNAIRGINRLRPLSHGAVNSLPEKFRKTILSMDADFMKLILRDLLEPDELDCLAGRLKGLQTTIRREAETLETASKGMMKKQARAEATDPELIKLRYLKKLKLGEKTQRIEKATNFFGNLLFLPEIDERIEDRKKALKKELKEKEAREKEQAKKLKQLEARKKEQEKKLKQSRARKKEQEKKIENK